MITVLIEENYAKNSRVGLILDGILSVTRRKRVAVEVYTDEKKIKSKPRVVVLICASLKCGNRNHRKIQRARNTPAFVRFSVYRHGVQVQLHNA